MIKLKGLATGIGSLPHTDAEAALDLIFKYCPQVPFWPQLPKRDAREGMLAQYSENLPGIKVTKGGVYFNTQESEKELEVFYEHIITQDVDYFKISPDFALGLYKFYDRLKKNGLKGIEFIKCHVTGPFTFASSINDEHGSSLLHNPVFMQAIFKGLAMKALWQIKFFKEFGKRIIVFLDEPYLGCFGSAFSPINREDVIKGLLEFTDAVKSEGVFLGVHCCGNTDWSIFTDTLGIDIINFDAFAFSERLVLYGDNLKAFFKRGGILCWGIVPTQESAEGLSEDLLIKKISINMDSLAKKGVDRELLYNNFLISPACGLGTLEVQKAEYIFKALSSLQEKLFDNLT